jgi:Tfp pilus assembly protein PilN
MNAVNLIPAEHRRSAVSAPGYPFLGLLGGLLVVLLATVVYIGARNDVSTKRSELAQVQAGVTQWSAAAERYAPYVSAAAHHQKTLTQVNGLLEERYDWSQLLGQIAGVMPAHAALSSVTAVTGAAAAGGSSIQVAACAVSQSVVADTMVALRRISGVSEVSLSTSARGGAGSGSGQCSLPIQFQVSVAFGAAQAPASTASSAATTSSAPAPAATASTTSSGAAQ